MVRAGQPSDRAAFLMGQQSPTFFGSAINNFGIQEVLDALVDFAPPPGLRPSLWRQVLPHEAACTAVVFKMQANMDPAHRDRIAFARICSGQFLRGMKLRVCRTGKELRTSAVVSFLSQRRGLLDEAYAGDIVGIPNHGNLQLGYTLTQGENLQFTGLLFFAPELFQSVELANPLHSKQLLKGLQELGEEGAIQVFKPCGGGPLLLGAVSALQFEVVAHRLEHEYGVLAKLNPSALRFARWVTSNDAKLLARFIRDNAFRVAHDAVEAPPFLFSYGTELKVTQERWPDVALHELREHAGLVSQQRM